MSNPIKYKVFVVDDELLVRKLILQQLKNRTDLEVHAFQNGEDCVSNLHQNPDIVLLDYHLNVFDNDKMNGLDTLEAIKMQNPDTKVTMLSSQENVSIAVALLNKGASNYIVKNNVFPLQAEQSINKVISHLELKEDIRRLTEKMKRDKLLMSGYALVGLMMMLFIASTLI